MKIEEFVPSQHSKIEADQAQGAEETSCAVAHPLVGAKDQVIVIEMQVCHGGKGHCRAIVSMSSHWCTLLSFYCLETVREEELL